MNKPFALLISPVLLGLIAVSSQAKEVRATDKAIAPAPTSTIGLESNRSRPQLVARTDSDTMDQVTAVSQLTDVRPTDWAFQALQSLVERYGCIAGYPDKTYRGNRALTRYEFAAGLNACLDRVNELIAASEPPIWPKKKTWSVLQKLQEPNFATELDHPAWSGRWPRWQGQPP